MEVPGKRGLNAFSNTALSEILQQREITDVVIIGVVVSICIDSTARAATERGYKVSVVSDCTSGRTVFEHEFYRDNIFPLYAQALINMGVYEKIEAYMVLFQEANVLFILKAAHNLARQQNNSNNIELAIERASKIVFSLKSYAHFEHTEKMVESSITENIDVVLTLYHNQLKQGIQVIMHCEEVPMITCYPDDLNQVWVNIIHNAIQAMDVKGTLTIEVAKKYPYIAVNITDSGAGIPEEIKDRIFEPFFTTKPRGEGSGLGLDIVRKVIEKHQGHINVTSQPGKTTFSVLLPM
jgi:signal transduction histidine kinase